MDDGLEPGGGPVNAAAPRTPGQRLLLGVVIGLGLLIMLALGGVVIGLAMKTRGTSPSSGSAAAALTLPAGAVIEAMEVSGNRLVLRIRTDTGEEIDIVDTEDGHVVSRIKAAPPGIPK